MRCTAIKRLLFLVVLGWGLTITSLSAQQRVTLLFAGDLMQHKAQIDAARTDSGTYDYTPCFARVKRQIEAADLAIGNLEVTLGGRPYTGYPAFSAPDEYLTAIRDAGFDVLLTANNHCLDRGSPGLVRTLNKLDSLHIPSLGTYRDSLDRAHRHPLLFTLKGIRIALLNYTYGTNGLRPRSPALVNYIDRKQMQQDIHTAQAWRPDVLIACIHWGQEYQSLPNHAQCELADWLFEQGVDHIIGSHPHVLQPMELRTDTLRGSQHVLAYSLGNFISNMSARGTDGGALLTLTLEKVQPMRTLRPSTRTVSCTYDLVWSGRPSLTGKQNFELYPVTSPIDSLPPIARNKLKIFTEDARQLLNRHNKGIYERNKINEK